LNIISAPQPPEALTRAALLPPYIAATTSEGRLLLWSPDTGAEVARLPPVGDHPDSPIHTLQPHPALAVAFAATAELAWAWDVNLGKPLVRLAAPAPIIAAHLTSDALPIAWALLADGGVIGWDLSCLLP
jgi:hypothetical protein